MADGSEFSFVISVQDIDTSLLPADARVPGTDAFCKAVTKLFEKDFADFGGQAKIIVTDKVVEVHYRADPDQLAPLEVALEKLRQGDYENGIRLLEVLRRVQPDDSDILYNLGMAYSDIGRLDEAITTLGRASSLRKTHVNAKVALGVAYSRQKDWSAATKILQEAIAMDATNPWAHRNLGACLIQERKVEEAERHLRKAVELNPSDQQSVYGLAQALHMLGNEKEADDLYTRVIDMDGRSIVAEQARRQRSKLAQQSFRGRSAGDIRMDAVMYLLGALQKFGKMKKEEIQKVAFEIAILGQRGIDTNDSTQKYQLKSLTGRFSGLHLMCLMYVGFQMIAPEHSIGFDLTKEYELAKTMYKAE